jgi:beta-barrel assembly-enhancing protease
VIFNLTKHAAALGLGLGLGLALGLASPASAQATTVDLPRIGEPADTTLSPLEERRIGNRVVAQLYAHEYILEDPEITEYLSGLMWRLVAASETRPDELKLFVLRDSRINAFALPGGFVGVNAGLLMAVSSESELAGVLAHELAHVTQRHLARAIEGTQMANIATWAAVLAAVLAASADPDVVIAALSIGQATTYQREVNFTRAHELEADRIGIRTLAQAGFDPSAVASFFVRLEQQSRLYGNQLPEFLRTHPVNTTRISEARARAGDYGDRRVTDPVEFGLMQARAHVLSADRPSQMVDHFLGKLRTNETSIPDRYGLALAYSTLGEYSRANKTLEPALEALPRQPNLSLLAGRILLGQRQYDRALTRLARTLEHHPRYAAAILGYADALLAAGKPEQARQVLLSHEQALGTRMETYRLLAFAARDVGNMIEAQYQMANFLFRRGDGGGALAQLDAALRSSNLSEHDRARLQARRTEIADAVPREQRRSQPTAR